MKKILYFASLLTVLAGAASCQKEIDQTQPQPQPSGELRQVIITAGPAVSKTSVSGGNLIWSESDKLNIVPQSGTVAAAALDIKSGAGTASGTFEGEIDESITDETDLYGWCGGDWTYSSGSFSVNMPASQTYVANGLAENAYPSIGTGTITNGITLSNPMGVLKLTVKAATANDYVKSISVTSAANNLAGAFTVTPGDTPTVSGGSSKTLTLSASENVALSSEGVNFYVVVPPAEYAAGDLSVKITFSDDSYVNTTFADAVTVTANNATAKEISDHTGRRGTLNGQEYVLIKAKYDGTNDSHLKWATQNLAVTTSGKAKWKTTDYIVGDYFQWAASYEGYGITAEADKKPANLVIYDSFTSTCTGGSSDSFTFKDGKEFSEASVPYFDDSSYSYTKYTSAPAILEASDDVASIVLGSTWRMPTGGGAGEIKAMRAVTYWAWDATDKGYYVFKPGVGTSGAANKRGNISGTDDKTKALLFFPAAGLGLGTLLKYAGDLGSYWSSALSSDSSIDDAYYLCFSLSEVAPECYSIRYYGFSVRPVSD